MKFLVIGDPHGTEKVFSMPVEEADAVIVPGDFGDSRLLRELYLGKDASKETIPKEEILEAAMQAYNSSMKILKFLAGKKPTFVVFGNVERPDKETAAENRKYGLGLPLLEKQLSETRNIYLLNNRQISFRGIKIAGNSFFVDVLWSRTFSPGSKPALHNAMEQEAEAKRFFGSLDYVDILITHQPPYGILDLVNSPYVPDNWKGKHAGSKMILEYVRKFQPRYHICSHIHEAKGMARIGKTIVINVGHEGDYRFIDV